MSSLLSVSKENRVGGWNVQEFWPLTTIVGPDSSGRSKSIQTQRARNLLLTIELTNMQGAAQIEFDPFYWDFGNGGESGNPYSAAQPAYTANGIYRIFIGEGAGDWPGLDLTNVILIEAPPVHAILYNIKNIAGSTQVDVQAWVARMR